ncbi:hypothetical protein [Nocardioides sp. SYSU DS0651]|uniref:hypothetical protein n=1 Tax=Nocardioides sp. SYSU DS0651 TaxID=3415955 RepID=UPI003F4C7A36
MSLNLYDLLDVEETASAAEIRSAWKAAIADLDPTDRRFRAYNDAAGVLLDPGRREQYDAELAAARAAESPEADDAPADDAGTAGESRASTESEPAADEPKADEPEADEPATDEPEADEPATDEPAADDPASAPPRWALLAAAVGAAVALVVAVALLVQTAGGASAQEIAERNSRQQRAAVTAEAAAEAMVAPVLSYSYKTMAADLDRIREYMTEEAGEKRAAIWPELTQEAEAQRVVVDATPVGTALTRISSDGDRATVLVFLDQEVTKRGEDPFVLKMWATLSLVRAPGDTDRWLLDDLCTEADCE